MEAELTDQDAERFKANRFDVVSQLADDLAHEIKNPLNAIIINLEVLKVRAAKGDADGAIDRARVIEQEARRLHQLVDRMLLLVRPDRDAAGSLPLDTALDELLPLIGAQVKLARNEFVVDCSAAVFVAVPRDVLKFALLNVLMAAHALLGDGGGTLTLSCEPDETSAHIGITTAFDDGRSEPDGAADGFQRAIEMARTMLGQSGGRIEARSGGVSVILPRTQSV